MEIDIYLKSKEEILGLVAAEAARLAPGGWIVARGWNHEVWLEKRWPCKEDLDAVAPGHPVVLTRADAHSLWANSLALQAVGITRDTPDPQGGEIHRDEGGEPTGILVDTAMYALWSAPPPLSAEQAREAYLKAQAEFFRLGITSVGDAWITPEHFAVLRDASRSGDLKVRVYGILSTESLENGNSADPFRDPNEKVFLAAFKIVSDGSLGSRSAWLLRDYADRPGHRGNGRYTDDELATLLENAVDLGFQPCVHAIGDAAVDQAVRVMERSLAARPSGDYRYRIEHFQVVEPRTLEKALRLGIVPAMQSVHAASDGSMARKRLNSETLAHAYPWRSVLERGGIFANGSDAPMDLLSPFAGLSAAVGSPHGISRQDALKTYTLWAAYAEFAENRKGSLEAGKLADFIIVDRDPMTCPVQDLAEVRVLATFVSGENVYRSRA